MSTAHVSYLEQLVTDTAGVTADDGLVANNCIKLPRFYKKEHYLLTDVGYF